jgi:hypothetical protein
MSGENVHERLQGRVAGIAPGDFSEMTVQIDPDLILQLVVHGRLRGLRAVSESISCDVAAKDAQRSVFLYMPLTARVAPRNGLSLCVKLS